jgi:hypothetical protein
MAPNAAAAMVPIAYSAVDIPSSAAAASIIRTCADRIHLCCICSPLS